jgi:hypothetical protein
MKTHLFAALFLLIASTAFAHTFDLAVLAGSPNEKQPFVHEILQGRITYVDSGTSDVGNFTDGIFYFAGRNGVRSALSVEILYKDGSAFDADFLAATRDAGARAAIALVPVGPVTEEYCRRFADHPDTVFIAGLGSNAERFDDSKTPTCFSSNILFVAGLNAEMTDLNSNQSWGELARVAVPYAGLKSPVDSRSSRSIGMAVAAGKMAEILRGNPDLRGAALIEAFLATATVELPSLKGKIAGSRALVDFRR